ncbi:MAG TPA: amidohydrolase family protein, partial [Planctomycetota bacterium]|nr:amidohydrolase family protein [Planctomycetota bacterium]
MIPLLLALLLPQADEADWVFRDAAIVDGSGGPGTVGDVAVKGDLILAVGRWTGTARRVVDARGLVVAPGFIDLHSHSDRNILDSRDNRNFTTQGCTAVVTGNCGGGRADVGAYLAEVDREGAATNVLHLVPHGAVRAKIFGSADRPPTPEELERMKAWVERGLQEGAWGMSTGLIYVPGTYAKTDEIVELAKVVAARKALYASHIRSEAEGLLEAVDEAIGIG